MGRRVDAYYSMMHRAILYMLDLMTHVVLESGSWSSVRSDPLLQPSHLISLVANRRFDRPTCLMTPYPTFSSVFLAVVRRHRHRILTDSTRFGIGINSEATSVLRRSTARSEASRTGCGAALWTRRCRDGGCSGSVGSVFRRSFTV